MNVVEDATPQLGGNLDTNQFSILLDSTPNADHSCIGACFIGIAAQALVIGDVCYLNSAGRFAKADADAEATTKGMLVMAMGTISSGSTGYFLLWGFVRDNTWNWTPGAELYVSCTPGNPTATKPSGGGDVVRIVGWAYNADVVWFKPDATYVEI
jgi:hypothetical protein